MARFYSKRRHCWFLCNLLQLKGSVFLRAAIIALPAAVFSAVAQIYYEDHPFATDEPRQEQIFTNNAIWSGFSFLVGFLVVFRTSHAYNRFWEGCTSVHKMGAGWFDACSALIAFTRVSKASQADVLAFQNSVIRLFSILHAVALAELEDFDDDGGGESVFLRSFSLPLVDAGAFDDETLMTVRDSTFRVELVYQWIQALIVEAADNHVLNVPPPILTRTFQQLSGGMLSFCEALKVADTPFPFPYSQTCDLMLVAMYVMAPFVVASYVSGWLLAAFFTFMVIFTFTCLTLISLELEFPYGQDANDIDAVQIQMSMNHRLRLLISRRGWRNPTLRARPEDQGAFLARAIQAHASSSPSLYALWEKLPSTIDDSQNQVATRRNNETGSANLLSYASNTIETVGAELLGAAAPARGAGIESTHLQQQGSGARSNPLEASIISFRSGKRTLSFSCSSHRRPHDHGITTEAYMSSDNGVSNSQSTNGEFFLVQPTRSIAEDEKHRVKADDDLGGGQKAAAGSIPGTSPGNIASLKESTHDRPGTSSKGNAIGASLQHQTSWL